MLSYEHLTWHFHVEMTMFKNKQAQAEEDSNIS
jgi:hypothetical protein